MEYVPCVVIIVLAIVALFWVMNAQGKRQENAHKAMLQAKSNYQASLAQLKQAPTNADLKQRTLELGRYYSSLTREQKGVTVYDEMALMNDISAATAGATSAPARASVEDRLRQLDDLRIKGLITEQEYSDRRRKLLDEV